MGPLGRRGWDPSKNKTQGGPAVGMESCGKTLKSEQHCLSANDFISVPESSAHPTSHLFQPAHGNGKDQGPRACYVT